MVNLEKRNKDGICLWVKLVIISSLILTSCKSKRDISYQKDDREKLSKLFAVNISTKDNIMLYREAAIWLNIPHKDNSNKKNGIDCSTFAYTIYKSVYQIELARNSSDIFKQNCKEINKDRLREGDLVFFNTLHLRNNPISHVGIYLKDGKFIHTSTSKGVMVSSLEEEYYRKTWVCGGRVKQYL